MEEIKKEMPRRRRSIIIAAAGIAVLLAAALIIGLLVTPALTEESDSAKQNAIMPLLYMKDGSAYMASGEHAVKLEGVKIVKNAYGHDIINGEFCANNEWLFYIANHNKTTGEGDLMRVASDGQSIPETVAQGVCDTKFSGDGKRVLYARGVSAGSLYALDMQWDKPRLLAGGVSWYALSANGRRALYVCGDQNTGDLYSWGFTGEPELISGGVCSEFCNGASLGHSFDYNCGFSPNAANIYYVARTMTKSGRDEYTLYVKIGSRKAEKVETRGENSLLSGCMFGNGHLSDNGQMLYFGRGLMLPPLYVFSPGGNIEHFSGECIVLTVFGDGSFLAESDGSLYYKAPGRKKQVLSDYAYFIPFFGRPFTEPPPGAEKRFLMWESSSDPDEGIPEKLTLFEHHPGEEKIKLIEPEAEPGNVHLAFDPSLKKLAYESDGILYFMQKENEGWSKPKKISDTGYAEISIYENTFDTSAEYMYYRQRESEDAKTFGLYRYTIKRRKSELLMQDVSEFYLIEDIPYAILSDGTLVRADSGERLEQDVQRIDPADGGIHIFTETGILYYGTDTDKPVTLCEDANTISAGGITYLPPLSDEIAAALKELCADAQRCIDALKAGGTESFWEYKAKAVALIARRDVSSELDGILIKFSEAFSNAGLWKASKHLDPEYKILGDDTTIEDFTEAIKECREYLETQGGI